MRKRLGIDVGGTYVKYAVLDESDRVIETRQLKTQGSGQSFIDFLTQEIKNILRVESGIEAIGIGIPGTVDPERGRIIDSPALTLHDVDFVERLKESFDQDIVLENDVNAWTMAEKAAGAAKDVDTFVMITIGTGIGAGIYYKGDIIRGMDYEAGEIGYFPMGLKAYQAQTTNYEFGHFESLASAAGVGRRYQKYYGKQASTREIFDLAQGGDPEALAVVNETMDYLAMGISNIICLLQPQRIVIGGGMANAGPWLVEGLTKRIKQLIPMRFELALSTIGKWGGAVGAAFIQ